MMRTLGKLLLWGWLLSSLFWLALVLWSQDTRYGVQGGKYLGQALVAGLILWRMRRADKMAVEVD